MSYFEIPDEYAEFIDIAFIADFYNEQWAPIPEFEHMAEVSTMGRVRTLNRWITNVNGVTQFKRGQIRAPARHRQGYWLYTLQSGTRRLQTVVHRLVALAFLGNPPWDAEGNRPLEVAHNNGRAWDCRLSNLRWATRRENIADQYLHGTKPRRLPREELLARKRERERLRRLKPGVAERLREYNREYKRKRGESDPAYRESELARKRASYAASRGQQ